jgi:hypothetical protein
MRHGTFVFESVDWVVVGSATIFFLDYSESQCVNMFKMFILNLTVHKNPCWCSIGVVSLSGIRATCYC